MAMDRAEYVRAVTEHKDRVHNFALWMLRHPDDARDVAQESLVRMWEHRARIRPPAAGPWLLRTTHNLCLDFLRRRRARPDVPADDPHAWLDRSQPDAARAAERRELHELVARCLQTLTPRDRAVLIMREFEGMTYDEMADLLDMNLGALKVALHRARDRLRERLVRAGVTP
jgi:RNA polymerase sigma-70 factor (ECF subfamily)